MPRSLTATILLLIAMPALADPDAVLERVVRDGAIPGIVAMVAKSERVIYQKAVGLADVAGGKPMQVDSIFRIASMTKPMTSVAMMQFVDDGRVDLDAPMSDYLDDFEPLPVLIAVSDGQPVYSGEKYVPTIRQLLSHSAGFGYSVWNDRLFAISEPGRAMPIAEFASSTVP